MNKFLLIILVISSFNAYSRSGRKGNGGGAWTCYNKNNTIRWIQLVDLYEAKNEFLLKLKSYDKDLTYRDILKDISKDIYKINQSLGDKVSEYLLDVMLNLDEKDVALDYINDPYYRIKPKKEECKYGKIEYSQVANYTLDERILINENLFHHPKFSHLDQAALVLHESIYSYLRDIYGDKDSIRTRLIVGYIFSDLSIKEKRKGINKALGIAARDHYEMNFVKIRRGSFALGALHVLKKEEQMKGNWLTRFFAPPEGGGVGRPVIYGEIEEDFEIMDTEVTQYMFFKVMGYNPSYFAKKKYCPKSYEKHLSHKEMEIVGLCPNHPVENLTYQEISAFIVALERRNSRGYRLPTEIEWEYASRSGSDSKYFFGEDKNDLSKYVIYNQGRYGKTHPIGPMRTYSKRRNSNKMYDVLGNVAEWTQDIFTSGSDTGGYGEKHSCYGRENMSSSCRMINRGGHFQSSHEGVILSKREYFFWTFNMSSKKSKTLGFRLIRE